MAGISDAEANVIIVIERVCSVFSLLGCLFVLVTFAFSPAFRQRAINRLVFLATFGNMLTNVATLMTRSYTYNIDSFGCQFQAFLIQVFMQGDAYWALAMAINVYLTFYHKYDARALRRMEGFYLAACYGVPFIPGFVFLFISNEVRGRPYGNAVLWCWFSPKWEFLRIATFYGPVWVAIVITMSIYIRAGRDIYMKRKKMLNFRSGNGTGTGTGTRNADEPGFFPINDFFSYKTTEVTHTTEFVQAPPQAVTKGGPQGIPPVAAQVANDNNISYSVTISADKPPERDSLDEEDEIAITPVETIENDKLGNSNDSSPTTGITPLAVITASATTTAGLTFPTVTTTSQQQRQARRRNDANNATWPYVKCSMLFFSALLITWIPSSGNRVYTLINDGDVSKPLFFASAFVLPLQGFWNAIIYMFTSWAACKSLWGTVVLTVSEWLPSFGRWGGGGGGAGGRRVKIVEIANRNYIKSDYHSHGQREGYHGSGGSRRLPGGKWGKAEESTSMEDLTGHAGNNGSPRGNGSSRTMDSMGMGLNRERHVVSPV